MKKIFYIALTIVLGLAGTSCDREKLTYDSEPGEISGHSQAHSWAGNNWRLTQRPYTAGTAC